MDHVVYLDAQAKELELLLEKKKSMILRGAAGRKMPYGRVNPGDTLYFINNNAEGLVLARGGVESVINSEKLEGGGAQELIAANQHSLQLTRKQTERWAGKRYLVLIGVGSVEKVEPFRIDKSNFSNMDDWLPVGRIDEVKIGD